MGELITLPANSADAADGMARAVGWCALAAAVIDDRPKTLGCAVADCVTDAGPPGEMVRFGDVDASAEVGELNSSIRAASEATLAEVIGLKAVDGS